MRTTTHRKAPRLPRSLALALLLAVVATGLALVVRATGVVDPYRAGTTHRVTLEWDATCVNAPALYLDGRSWDATGPEATGVASTRWRQGTPYAGTLEVTATDEAVFRADDRSVGVDIPYHRVPEGAFGSPNCYIR